jgi:5-methylcytosine-specific restriction endonuclease McrA
VAHPNLESVRQRYDFRCGYCGVSEVDAGGDLTVDHFHPVSAGGDDSDDNLVYACMRCNLHKSDYTPDTADRQHGRRILHPLKDDLAQHFQENSINGRLEALTETGRFHITILRLNPCSCRASLP